MNETHPAPAHALASSTPPSLHPPVSGSLAHPVPSALAPTAAPPGHALVMACGGMSAGIGGIGMSLGLITMAGSLGAILAGSAAFVAGAILVTLGLLVVNLVREAATDRTLFGIRTESLRVATTVLAVLCFVAGVAGMMLSVAVASLVALEAALAGAAGLVAGSLLASGGGWVLARIALASGGSDRSEG